MFKFLIKAYFCVRRTVKITQFEIFHHDLKNRSQFAVRINSENKEKNDLTL